MSAGALSPEVPESSNQAEPGLHAEYFPGLIHSDSVLHMIEVRRPLLDRLTPSIPIEAVSTARLESRSGLGETLHELPHGIQRHT